jgi:hypothetical protein
MRVVDPKIRDEWCLLSEWTRSPEKNGVSKSTKANVAGIGLGRAQLTVQVRTVENHCVENAQT